MSLKSYTPDELYEKFRQAHDAVSPSEFYSSPRYKKPMEFWCAAQFGRAFSANLNACSLLASDRDEQTESDFFLEVSGQRYPFQIVESLTPGRRRGDEYKSKEPKTSTLNDWDAGATNGPLWVKDHIQKKFNHYGGDVSSLNLLVYVNFPAHEHNFEDMCFASSELASKWASVWLLNGNAICCISGSDKLGGPYPWLFIPAEP